MRRTTITMLSVIALLVLAGVGLVLASPARADDASASHSVIGSWHLSADDALGSPTGDPTLATFAPDGSLILSGRAVRPALPGNPFEFTYFSTGHGAWEAKDDGSIAFSIAHLRSDESGTFRGTTVVSGTLEVAADGQTMSGDETFAVGDPTGTVLTVLPFAIEGERIQLQPMADRRHETWSGKPSRTGPTP